MAPEKRNPSSGVVLVLAVLLLCAFLGLVAYQKFYASRARQESDQLLLDELASAELIEGPPASAADWPQWRGPHRDGVVTEPRLLTRWPARGPKHLWQASVGQGFSCISTSAGRACTLYHQGDEDVVICWQADSGKELWRFPYAAPSHRDYPGPRSSPTFDGDRVYTLGAGGQLHCLEAATGHVLWHHNLAQELGASGGQWGLAFSPLIEGDLLIATPGGKGTAVVAYDKKSGALAWKAQTAPAGYSSPVAFTAGDVRQLVVFTGDSVMGLAPADGRLLWNFPWATNFDVNAATPLTFHARSGGKLLDYVLVSSGYGKGCALLKITKSSSGDFTAHRVYENNSLCSHFASPVRLGQYIYGFNESALTCLDLRTGETKWKKSGFNKGSLLRVDNYLLVLGETGKLALMEASPEEPMPIATAQPLRSRRTWTMPTLSGGKLYLRDEEQATCLEMVSE